VTGELGATYALGATQFRVWAPDHQRIELVLEGTDSAASIRLAPEGEGFYAVEVPGLPAGTLYRYRVDGAGPFPDPASRFQPAGVHGPSEVIDPFGFAWSDQRWTGIALEDAVIYELHVGAFTPPGTFAAAAEKLPLLLELGITAVQLMPVADFPGRWNWGYDAVAPFAPSRAYGRPDDLRRFVDQAHRLGLAVYLDVIYNHLGPDGAYQGSFTGYYFSTRHQSPWGAGINYDGPRSGPVRSYAVTNAVRWITEYHADGLRLDATHAIVDQSPSHIVAGVVAAARAAAAARGRPVQIIAEDARDLAFIVRSQDEGGWGADAVYGDDFHHHLRRLLAGDQDGYFASYEGTASAIAATIRHGWWFRGDPDPATGKIRGSDPSGIPCAKVVVFLQDHDQVGNRAFGDRLQDAVDLAAVRAATVLLLLGPATPLLFMGQEWAATAPFRYFTDHAAALGRAVTEGRRREFGRFRAFADPELRDTIPDPQAESTFAVSHLDWDERIRSPHREFLALHRRLLALRRAEPSVRVPLASGQPETAAWDQGGVWLRRTAPGQVLLVVARLVGPGELDLTSLGPIGAGPWQLVLDTEEAAFAPDPTPARIEETRVRFARPGAVLLRSFPGAR
jgi:maltooligosyltrehalose trehalohydrolase